MAFLVSEEEGYTFSHLITSNKRQFLHIRHHRCNHRVTAWGLRINMLYSEVNMWRDKDVQQLFYLLQSDAPLWLSITSMIIYKPAHILAPVVSSLTLKRNMHWNIYLKHYFKYASVLKLHTQLTGQKVLSMPPFGMNWNPLVYKPKRK